MLAGHVQGKKRSLSSMFEAVGSYAAGTMTEDELLEMEEKVCPTCGSCSGMYTANSMNCLTEVLGMGLKGNGTIPAVYSERLKLAKHAGMQVMELFRKNIRPDVYKRQKRMSSFAFMADPIAANKWEFSGAVSYTHLDEGEVETVSHYYAAAFFDPEVDCILDIGGQDMKCIKIKNQTVDSVQLNEACSSGCG